MQANTAPVLPRETRDTLLILGSVALVLLPQVAYLPGWASALALCMLAWRLWMARQGQNLPGKWLLAALLALAIGATVLQFRSIVGPEAGVVLVVLLLVLARSKHVRDEMYILLIHYNGDGVDEDVRRALGTHPYQIKSKTMRKEDAEMAIEVRVRKKDLSFVDRIRAMEKVLDITVVQYNGDYID